MDSRRQLNGHDSHENHEIVLQSRQGQMLNARPYVDHTVGSTEAADDFAVLVQYAQILWKSKWILISAALVGIVFATVITLQMTPLYRARTSMQIENIQEPFVAKQNTTTD